MQGLRKLKSKKVSDFCLQIWGTEYAQLCSWVKGCLWLLKIKKRSHMILWNALCKLVWLRYIVHGAGHECMLSNKSITFWFVCYYDSISTAIGEICWSPRNWNMKALSHHVQYDRLMSIWPSLVSFARDHSHAYSWCIHIGGDVRWKQDRIKVVLFAVLVSGIPAALIKYWDQDQLDSALFSVHFALSTWMLQ